MNACAIFGIAVCIALDASWGWWLLGFVCLVYDEENGHTG